MAQRKTQTNRKKADSASEGPLVARRRRVTLKDVAAAAGLSITQTSRALAGYDDVAQATQARVRRLAQELGYRPSLRARTLVSGRKATTRCAVVSLDVPAEWLYRSSYSPLLLGILGGAAAGDLDVYLATLNTQPPAEALEQLVAEDRADGIVLLTFMTLGPEHVAPLEEAGVPYVLANRHFAHIAGAPTVNSVTPDWVSGTRDAVERLHGLGHQNLAALFPANETSTTRDHLQGWSEGSSRCGLDPACAPIISQGLLRLGEKSGYDIGRDLLTHGLPDTGNRPTAIVTHNDEVAHGVLRAARELDVDVPRQLSVIGFDNLVANYMFPPLCTYDPHFYRVGEQAATRLASLLHDEEAEGQPPLRIMLPLDFICRSTCAPAP